MTYVAYATPTLTIIASAMQTVNFDPALRRALDRALMQLANGVRVDFDGTELRIPSASRREAGIVHVSDGRNCTCEGGKHPFCWHRAMFKLLFAEAAIERPAALVLAICSQMPRHTNKVIDITDAFDEWQEAA